MRYPPEQIEPLAAGYVLGTLQGPARRRFEALMRDRADVRAAVWRWEQRLHGFAGGLEPLRPPKRVWRGVRRRLGGGRSVAAREGVRWWPRLAVLVPVVAASAFWLGTTLAPPALPDRVAVFAAEDARALWIVTADVARGLLVVETAGVSPPADGAVYELWALPADAVPYSLGVLRAASGRYESSLSPAAGRALQAAASLAISVEPPGGSPTGQPTGPVIHQAALVRL